VPVQARATESGPASRASLPAFADLAERVSPAVVNIKVTAVARTGVG
jgi:S1-C subfamily serine protease